MVRERQKIESCSQIRRLGVAVKVTDYVEAEQDAYGTTPAKTDKSPYTVQAVPSSPSSSEFETVTGDYASYNIVFYVASEDVATMSDKNPTDITRTEIEYNGRSFEVDTLHTLHNAGVAVLAGND